MKNHIWAIALTLSALGTSIARAADEDLRQQIEELSKTLRKQQEQIQHQQEQLNRQDTILTDHGIGKKSSTDFKESPEWKSLQTDVATALEAGRQKRPGMFNPSMSLAIDTITSYTRNNGVDFTPRDVELMLQANVDHLARGYVVFNAATELGLNGDGLNGEGREGPFRRTGPSLGIEEAALETTDLPWGLSLKGGQFFADFTRMDKVHPHDRPFVDGPRSLDTIIGGETQARGFELQWLTPLDHYLRITTGIVDGIGAEAPGSIGLEMPDGTTKSAFNNNVYRGFNNLTYYMRGATIFDLSPGVNLNLGADYARNFHEERRQLASADFKLEWKPASQRSDLLTWGAEGIWSRVEGNLPVDSFLPASTDAGGVPFSTVAHANSIGAYTYLQYRFGKFLEPGFRFDATMPQSFELRDNDGDGNAFDLAKIQDRFFTYSPYVTINFSEFNRLRLQFNYVDVQNDPSRGGGNVQGTRSDLQFLLQWTILLGDHKHSFMP